jgi:hypothetical protein
MPKPAMEFMKYDKISDDVYVLGPNTILRFSVALSKIANEKRYHFYKEFEYSSRAQDYPKLLSIKRSFDYYLSLENIQKNKATDEKAFIRIGPTEVYKFVNQLEQVQEWFTAKKYKGLFSTVKGKLVLTNPTPECTLGGYPQNKFLRFIPTIIDKGEGKNSMEPGVELALSSYDNYVVMDVNRMMGLYYTVKNFNMYIAAQNLVGYIGFPSGMNRIEMGNSANYKLFEAEEPKIEITGVNDRVIGSKKNISSLE